MRATVLWMLPLLLSMSACASVGPALRPGCEWAHPIYMIDGDVVPYSETEHEIIKHNEAWAANCPDGE